MVRMGIKNMAMDIMLENTKVMSAEFESSAPAVK
jgi:hypothetical protein